MSDEHDPDVYVTVMLSTDEVWTVHPTEESAQEYVDLYNDGGLLMAVAVMDYGNPTLGFI